MVEVQARCAFIVIGLIVVSVLCIKNWTSWEDFRKEEEAHHHNPFTSLFFAILITLGLLNWRLILALFKTMFQIAKGTGPLSLVSTAYLVLLLVFWTMLSDNWEKKKEKEEYVDATWQLSYIGSIVTPIMTAAFIAGIVKTGGKIC